MGREDEGHDENLKGLQVPVKLQPRQAPTTTRSRVLLNTRNLEIWREARTGVIRCDEFCGNRKTCGNMKF